MKNIFKNTFMVVAMSAVLFSCEDAIDIQQPGRLTEETTFVSVQDLQDGLIGAYGQFDRTREIAMAAYFTDETAEGAGSGGQGRTTSHIFNLNAGSAAPSTFWTNGYDELNAINRVIGAAEFVETESAAEEAEKNNILGQLYALRAFAHATLWEYYTVDYTDRSSLSAIAMDFVPSIADQLPRNTCGEMLDLIFADLTLADNLLQEQSNPIFISKDFVIALRARLAAYTQDYATAESLATTLVNRYPLANAITYPSIFTDQSDQEIIFKLLRQVNGIYDGQGATGSVSAGGWAGASFAFVNATLSGSPYMEISRALFNLMDPSDIRYSVNVGPESIVAPDYTNTGNYRQEDILLVYKYPGTVDNPLLQDLKIFRSSEMQLIIAEARAAQGNLPGAAQAVKELRDIRLGADTALPSYSNQQEAFADIMKERRVELAFEGHRWKDIKRLGVRAGVGVERDPIDAAEFNMTRTLPATDYRFTLPIPIVETNANPVIAEQQTPGYSNN